jgi:hypothetical protein
MSIFDKLRKNATKLVDQHGDKVANGLDKAADAADKRTKGKYSGQIRTGLGKAKEGLDKLDDKRDQDLGGPASPDAGPPGTPPKSGPRQPPGSGSTPPKE